MIARYRNQAKEEDTSIYEAFCQVTESCRILDQLKFWSDLVFIYQFVFILCTREKQFTEFFSF